MKAIIFDCDGTLVDTEMMHYIAWAHALKKRGHDFTIEEYYGCVGTPIDVTAQRLSKKMGISSPEELRKDKHSHFCSLIQKGVDPIKDTLTFLHQLVEWQKHFKYKLAVASGASREEISIFLRHLKIEHLFDVILSGKEDLNHYNDPEGVNKPKPYIYLEAAKQLGLNPQDCVAVEDSHIGVMASAKAGCVTVAVPTSFSLTHDFSLAHKVINSFNDYTVDRFFGEMKA